MILLIRFGVLLIAAYVCEAGYGSSASSYSSSYNVEQADVQAPPYVPSYLKHQKSSGNMYKKTYGAKTVYSGTKTATKTGYTATKTGYSGTKTGYSGKSYTGSKTWYSSSGSEPKFEEFKSNANQPYKAVCTPDCQNAGICVSENTCHCPPQYTGARCEEPRRPCLALPPLPGNSRRQCTADFCTITCREGHQFFDGSTVATLRCAGGAWTPSRADLSALTDCAPRCEPPCLRGGVCLARGVCQCPEDRRGPQCQYEAAACDIRKSAFNGNYNCTGDADGVSCRLACPAGAEPGAPLAALYSCAYAEGRFEPSPVPLCVFKEVVIITPGTHHHSYNSTYYETYENSSSSGYSKVDSEESGSQVVSQSQLQSTHTDHGHSNVQVIIEDKEPQPGSCLTWGGAHYKTFDGKIYSFTSPCQHVLARDSEHTFTIAVRHAACARPPHCPAEITVYLGDKEYMLTVGEGGAVVFRSARRLIPVPAALPGLRVREAGGLELTLDDAGLRLLWDTNNEIVLEASTQLWNRTQGLCGTLDGLPETDFVARDGSAARTQAAFVSSWQVHRIGETCDSPASDAAACAGAADGAARRALLFCADLFRKEQFKKCGAVMDVSKLLETCQRDYCACATSEEPEQCACAAAGVLARECERRGVRGASDWRDADTCPMKCPENKIYTPCMPASPPSCAFPSPSPAPAAPAAPARCAEGCACAPGLLLDAGKCVSPAHCPCRLRNRSFKPGATVIKECNTCTCAAGAWRCSAAACGARCGAVGDPHYTTFDGVRYDFMGRCSYHLLRSDNVTVEAENVACDGAITEAMNLVPPSAPSCTRAVTVRLAGATIHLGVGGRVAVDGAELHALPARVPGALVRAASSLFVVVQLSMGVDVWWDGSSRVFVDVPPEFSGRTKGLCGTFNRNQQDDFLTPEGDVERAPAAFADAWRTSERCARAAPEPEHPCVARVENKAAAEKYCARLKSKLFEPCHWHVDVAPYVAACLYDMCACAGDAARCLCPALGDYAAACARQGVLVQWRYSVKECELQCTGGQEYTVCADSCVRTCADVAINAACRPSCVEGCACAPGQVLDASNTCVPVGLCPCMHKGREFQPGYKEVRPGRRERELCTCVGARWSCAAASAADVRDHPAAEDVARNCSRGQQLVDCLPDEPVTCKNMHLPPAPAAACRPGCACAPPAVLDAASGACVPPAQCPCHHAGRSYADGETMRQDCNTCTCAGGRWACGERACRGTCAAWGDSLVRSLDGREFAFEGVCEYLLAKGGGGGGDGGDGFEVLIQNAACGSTGATCSKSVSLRVTRAAAQETAALAQHQPLPDLSGYKSIQLRLAGAYVFLDAPALGVSLQWDRAMRVYLRLDPMWRDRVKGLCGNYNSDSRDDFQPPGGGVAEASALLFADAWRTRDTCPKAEPVKDHCAQRPTRSAYAAATCGRLKRAPFAACHAHVPVAAYVSACEQLACACDGGGDCACTCAALAHYAYLCAARGVPVRWRTPELCPMQCDEECSTYSACMSACPPAACGAPEPAGCQDDTCVEGCQPKLTCPEGSVYTNASHSSCSPRAACPACALDGRALPEGALLSRDACHECRCSRGERVCSGAPCDVTQPTTTEFPELPPPGSQDEPLKCVSGWTAWLSRGAPEPGGEAEPLPLPKELQIGTPMCAPSNMTAIECLTADGRTAKQTGLDAECSLERGLVCRGACPDFRVRVLCDCGDVFQCLNATHPNHEHPTDCAKFYECTPEAGSDKPHAVLKSCAPGLMYNPVAMVCDWPAAVAAVRPLCGAGEQQETTSTSTTTTTTTTEPPTTLPSSAAPTAPAPAPAEAPCPPGQIRSACAVPCDRLCHYYKKSVQMKENLCLRNEKCVPGCVPAAANASCPAGALRRDARSCVRPADCTCMADDGTLLKPGATYTVGCITCQCLSTLHCDSSACVSVSGAPAGSTHAPLLAEPHLLVTSARTPPPACPGGRFKPLLWQGEPLPDSAFTASSVASSLFAPQHAALDGHPTDVTAGSWSPSSQDRGPYLQVRLPRRRAVLGAALQGSPLRDQYVTAYELLYGDDGVAFERARVKGGSELFRGPIDHNTTVVQMLDPPIEAQYIRIRPMTWHEEISIRFELIGCDDTEPTTATVDATTATEAGTTATDAATTATEAANTATDAATTATDAATTAAAITPAVTAATTEEVWTKKTTESIVWTTVSATPPPCADALGLSGGLSTQYVEVSSHGAGAPQLALDAARGWTPLYSTPGEWIMFNFTSPRTVTGIKTKGGRNGWVTAYNIMYTSDLTTFNPMLDDTGSVKVYPGNFDSNSSVYNEFSPPIHAQYLKLLPVKWKDNIEIRIEPFGCFEPYPPPPPPPPAPAALSAPCPACAGAPAPPACCAAPLLHDGEGCVAPEQCPCFVGYMAYAVGSSYRGVACDTCVCKLGGVPACEPVRQCKCADNQRPSLTASCECACAPCPAGARLCPGSGACLDERRWCDGLQDCPDDERNCSAATTVEPTVGTTVAPISEAKSKLSCPTVECPPGYELHVTTGPARPRGGLAPPRPRLTYLRYFKGGSKGGAAKGGYAKGGFAKGYSAAPTKSSQAFTLARPAASPAPAPEPQPGCVQFKCVPALRPRPPPGAPAPACAVPLCPRGYQAHTHEAKGECPVYTCAPPPAPPARCALAGRTLRTFDGSEYKVDVCYHILARETRRDDWTVLARKKCRVDGCSNELLVRQDDQLILVKPSLMVEYDNYEYTVEQSSLICFQRNSFDLARLGKGLLVTSRKYNFTVYYSTDGDITIGVPASYKTWVDGLCGYYDGAPDNDRRLPGGRAAAGSEQFADAWARPGRRCAARAVPEATQRRVWALCDAVSQPPLANCAKFINLASWRSICLEKVCECSAAAGAAGAGAGAAGVGAEGAGAGAVGARAARERECRCDVLEQAAAECAAAGGDPGDWRTMAECPATCPPPLSYVSCYARACEPTCGARAPAPACGPRAACVPGCYCPAGTLRRGDDCVPPAECRDCVCDAARGRYVSFQQDELPGGACAALASQGRGAEGAAAYEVYATKAPCKDTPSMFCIKSIHLLHDHHIIKIDSDPTTQKPRVEVDGSLQYRYPLRLGWLAAARAGADVAVVLPHASVELIVQPSLEFTLKVSSHVYANRTRGLCGECGGARPGLALSDGAATEDVDLFEKSWRAPPEVLATLGIAEPEACQDTTKQSEELVNDCEMPESEKNLCNLMLDVEKFGACHPLVEPAGRAAECAAACGRAACAALASYAAECARHGLCARWRTDDCPYECPAPLEYSACGCDVTCDSNSTGCARPAEGCYCPEGKVRVNDTCIEPKKCFPCDADKEHYAGDEWQEDACTTCTCTRSEARAQTSCTRRVCAAPTCAVGERAVVTERPGQCCPEYVCVANNPRDSPHCPEPKQLQCGYGQQLKTRAAAGCQELVCECIPASECPPLAPPGALAPGWVADVDRGGCCPRAVSRCERAQCPAPPACAPHETLRRDNDTGCCEKFECVVPADKCVATLEWEGSPAGGARARQPETVLKDLDDVWLNGPCLSCECALTPAGPRASCREEVCAAPPGAGGAGGAGGPVGAGDALLWEMTPVPFACCPRAVPVACRDGDQVYKVGEEWSKAGEPCVRLRCAATAAGLQRAATAQVCHTDCLPGWEYRPADDAATCCGACVAVACVAAGVQRRVGDTWTSDDRCANYTCLNVNGTLQVSSVNESCPALSAADLEQFVWRETQAPGRCCPRRAPVACRDGGRVYQVNETWSTSDPCRNRTCSASGGRLSVSQAVQACGACGAAGRRLPAAGGCCGECEAVACEVDGLVREIGSTWYSADNCTTYTCTGEPGRLSTTVSAVQCPSVQHCPAEDLYNDTCCVRCRERPRSLVESTCKVTPLAQSVGAVSVRLPGRGRCVNREPAPLAECRGSCVSATLYDNQTNSHSSVCACCQATRYAALTVALACEDGSARAHRVGSPVACACRACGAEQLAPWNLPTEATTASHRKGRGDIEDNEIPDMYRRFGR